MRHVVKKKTNEAQCFRLLRYLKKRRCTTIEARCQLDILAPAVRIYELRHEYGYNIQTCMTNARNPGGSVHKVARYVLLPGKYQEKV